MKAIEYQMTVKFDDGSLMNVGGAIEGKDHIEVYSIAEQALGPNSVHTIKLEWRLRADVATAKFELIKPKKRRRRKR
jgi:hypothetical protein